MRFFRIIQEDILRLNSLRPAVKIACLIFVILLIGGACYLGAEWWKTSVVGRYRTYRAPRWELPLVVLGIIFICYIISLIERYRKSR